MKPESYEKWKEYFESTNCSIYKIIENAIMVAAMDDPKNFREKRDQIGERLYSAVKMCDSCCSYVVVENHFKSGECGNCEAGFHQTSHYTIEETEELGQTIEEEQENLGHILEIKKRLDNNEKEAETEMVHLLKTLSLIVQSVEDLKSTLIGKTVSNLQYHWSSKVTEAARNTIDIFKKVMRDRASDNAALSERSKDTEPHTNWGKTALPTVPMDGEINMCSIPPEDFSNFFDSMDHFDENPKVRNKIGKAQQRQTRGRTENKGQMKMVPTNKGSGSSISRNNLRKEKQQLTANSRPSNNGSEIGMIREGRRNPPPENKRKMECVLREELESSSMVKCQKPSRNETNEKLTKRTNSRPSDTEFSLQRFKAYKMQMEATNEMKTREEDVRQKPRQRANSSLTNQSPSDDATNLAEKLEISKRKLKQGYRAHEKSRRITKYIPDVGNIPKDNSTSRTSRKWNSINNRRNLS